MGILVLYMSGMLKEEEVKNIRENKCLYFTIYKIIFEEGRVVE